jgi:Alw26I/Eco31I/Esp3I family type II restriction endonuclease
VNPADNESARPRYGDRRRPWHPEFVEYMYRIVEDPAYAGMPCTTDDEGKIDWSIPSNRKPGSKNWNGNALRREWWRKKALTEGTASDANWLSATAKKIHPLRRKPCQTCGRWMSLAYVYPSLPLLDFLNALLPDHAQLERDDFLDIYEVAEHLAVELGFETARSALAKKFGELGSARDVNELKDILRREVVPREPRGLSPGAMSNAPDRLDGFHSYNLCCRSRHDTGRSSTNLRSYGVDRRAFEQWCEGDWTAANYLMTQVGVGACMTCGREAQLTADHIGPISLGFAHSPYFAAVCVSCNSGKNNRMKLADVERLLELEREVAGDEPVVSWQARALWERCKSSVRSDEDALLLSRLMRANQHVYLLTLAEIAGPWGMPDCLLQFLQPERAEYRVEFDDLDPETLRHGGYRRVPRQPTYARSQGARMVRIAFEALKVYASKERRNVRRIDDPRVEEAHRKLEAALVFAEEEGGSWREDLNEVLALDEQLQDVYLSALFESGYKPPEEFAYVREALGAFFEAIAEVLAEQFAAGTTEALDEGLLRDEL